MMCRDRKMLVVVEGRRLYCWSCGVSGPMAKACPRKKVTLKPKTTAVSTATTTATVGAGTGKAPGYGWEEMVAKGRKYDGPPKQQQPTNEQPEEQT